MTAALDLLAECHANGIWLLPAENGQLIIDAPRDALTPELLQRLRDCKPTLMALLSDCGGHEREERVAIAWCENGPTHEVDAALRAAIDGFEQLHRDEGLKPVDVNSQVCAAQDVEVAVDTRSRPTVPVEVEWPGAAADFCLLLTADDLPEIPFRLNGWTQVTDAAKLLRSLRADILRGLSGPQAFYGALQTDLLALQSFALQTAKIRES